MDDGKEFGRKIYLRNEEEHERLAEVSEDRDDGQSHSGPVAEGVTDKNTGRVLERKVTVEKQKERITLLK